MKITYRKPDIRIKRLALETTILAGSDKTPPSPVPKEEEGDKGQYSKGAGFGTDFDTDDDTYTIPRLRSLWDD